MKLAKQNLKIFRDDLSRNITADPIAVTGFFTFTFVDRRTNWRLQISIIKDPARQGLDNVDVSFIAPTNDKEIEKPKAFSLLVDDNNMQKFLEDIGREKIPQEICDKLSIRPEWFVQRKDLSLMYYRAENHEGVVRLEAKMIFHKPGFYFDQVSYKLSEDGPCSEVRSSTIVENVTLSTVMELFIRLIPDKNS